MKTNILILVLFCVMLSLTSKAQVSVDVHSHLISPDYLSYIKEHHAEMEEGFPLPEWDVVQHLAFMQEAEIETSVLTMTAPQPYFGNAEECARLIRKVNRFGVDLKNRYPGKFLYCASLPLPDINAAVREAIFALDTLKADGIKLATNSRGQYLGDPQLDTLMQVLNERKALIILHPHKPEPYSAELMKQTPLAMQEYLGETTRAVCNMLTRNVLARYNCLKVVVPHCGSYLPMAVQRMKSVYPVVRQAGMVGEIDWEKNLSALYYDLAGGHSPEIIKMMLTITTPDHLMYGSDYPYIKKDILIKQLDRMNRYLSDDTELAPYKQPILYDNAKKLFE